MAKRTRPVDFDRIARRFRVAEAARRGIRAVPSKPGPAFLVVKPACDERPKRCGACTCSCLYGFEKYQRPAPAGA